jgi:hypothetical protein
MSENLTKDLSDALNREIDAEECQKLFSPAGAAVNPKKTIDADIRERIEATCRSIMDDHPEVEAIGVMFLSKQLMGVLSGMIVGAEGPKLRPDQNVRLFEIWTKIGMQLLANNQRDVMILDEMLGQYARKLTDAQAKTQILFQPERAAGSAGE